MEIQHTKWMGFNKAILRGKFIVIIGYIKKERFQANNLALHPQETRKRRQN